VTEDCANTPVIFIRISDGVHLEVIPGGWWIGVTRLLGASCRMAWRGSFASRRLVIASRKSSLPPKLASRPVRGAIRDGSIAERWSGGWLDSRSGATSRVHRLSGIRLLFSAPQPGSRSSGRSSIFSRCWWTVREWPPRVDHCHWRVAGSPVDPERALSGDGWVAGVGCKPDVGNRSLASTSRPARTAPGRCESSPVSRIR